MHILEIVSFLPPYGGYFAIEQATALQQAGNRVGVLYCQQLSLSIDRWRWVKGKGPGFRFQVSGSKVQGPGFKFQGVDIEQRYFRGIPKTIRVNEERFCKIVGEMFDEYVSKYGKPDVLHAQAAKWAGVAAMKISERTGIPYFVTEHFSRGSYEMDFGKGWAHDTWAKDLIRQCYENARCVIPVAEELVADTACYFGKDYRYKAVSNVTDVEYFKPPIPQRGKSNNLYRFCCLAIANKGEFYRKGYDVLAKAWQTLSLTLPHNGEGSSSIELHIAGRDTDTKFFRQLFEQYYGAPLPDNVILHGDLSREKVRDLLYQSDALVLASRSEVQPLVVMEALSTGIPVVGTEVVPQCERVDGGVLIAKTGDAESLCECMKKVMNIKPSQEFHDKVAALSSAETISAQLMAIFNGSCPL